MWLRAGAGCDADVKSQPKVSIRSHCNIIECSETRIEPLAGRNLNVQIAPFAAGRIIGVRPCQLVRHKERLRAADTARSEIFLNSIPGAVIGPLMNDDKPQQSNTRKSLS